MARKVLWTFIVIFLAAIPSVAAKSCDEYKSIIRVDDRSERLFVQAHIADINSSNAAQQVLAFLKSFVADCRASWNSDWRVSFFAKRELAGYKDDPSIVPHVQSGEWQHGYIGEYLNKTSTLTLRPLDPKRLRRLRLGSR